MNAPIGNAGGARLVLRRELAPASTSAAIANLLIRQGWTAAPEVIRYISHYESIEGSVDPPWDVLDACATFLWSSTGAAHADEFRDFIAFLLLEACADTASPQAEHSASMCCALMTQRALGLNPGWRLALAAALLEMAAGCETLEFQFSMNRARYWLLGGGATGKADLDRCVEIMKALMVTDIPAMGEELAEPLWESIEPIPFSELVRAHA